jgi:hypothetical protein
VDSRPRRNKALLLLTKPTGSYMGRSQLAITLTLSSLILPLTISGQLQSASAAEGHLPKIFFEKTVCDLGDVGQATKNTCKFGTTS